jgi:ribosome-associated protein
MKKFMMKTPFITIGQLLKAEDFINSGGEAKFFLYDNEVFINGEKTSQRGKKIYPDDLVKIENIVYKMIYDQKD